MALALWGCGLDSGTAEGPQRRDGADAFSAFDQQPAPEQRARDASPPSEAGDRSLARERASASEQHPGDGAGDGASVEGGASLDGAAAEGLPADGARDRGADGARDRGADGARDRGADGARDRGADGAGDRGADLPGGDSGPAQDAPGPDARDRGAAQGEAGVDRGVDQGADGGSDGPFGSFVLSGSAQKGPFILGSTVVLSLHDARGNPSGEVYHTVTTSDLGEFALRPQSGGLAKLSVTGFYYNEYWGRLSVANLSLHAFALLGGVGRQKANINLVTHLSQQRVLALIGGGLAPAEAITQAESELHRELDIIRPLAIQAGSALDLLGGATADNAYLFALGCIFTQAAVDAGGSDGELQALINGTAADLAPDGQLDQARKNRLSAAERALDPEACSAKFAAWLTSQGSTAPVPPLALAVDTDKDGVANASDDDDDNDGAPDAFDCAPFDATRQLALSDGRCVADDGDADDDGVPDGVDCAPRDPTRQVWLVDGTSCVADDEDDDDDGVADGADCAPRDPTRQLLLADGTSCVADDGDADDDGVPDGVDCAPRDPALQLWLEGKSACVVDDEDDDNDGVPDAADCAPLAPDRSVRLVAGHCMPDDDDDDDDRVPDAIDCAPTDTSMPEQLPCPTPGLCNGVGVVASLDAAALGGAPRGLRVVGSQAFVRLADRTVIVDLSAPLAPRVAQTVFSTLALATATRSYALVGQDLVASTLAADGTVTEAWRWSPPERHPITGISGHPTARIAAFATDASQLYVIEPDLVEYSTDPIWARRSAHIWVFSLGAASPTPLAKHDWVVTMLEVTGAQAAGGYLEIVGKYHYGSWHGALFDLRTPTTLRKLLTSRAKGNPFNDGPGAGESRILPGYYVTRLQDGVFGSILDPSNYLLLEKPKFIQTLYTLPTAAKSAYQLVSTPGSVGPTRYYGNAAGALRIGELRADSGAYCDNNTLLGGPIVAIDQIGQRGLAATAQGLFVIDTLP